MKIFFRSIHLYLSLAAGVVIMVACFTGAVLVFENELQEAFNHDRYYVAKQAERRPIEKIIAAVKEKVPAAKISGVKVYTDPERSVEISISKKDPGQVDKKEKTGEEKPGTKQQSVADVQRDSVKNIGNAKGDAAATKRSQAPRAGRATHTVFVNPYTAEVLEVYSYRETFFYTMFALHRWLLGGQDSVGKYIVGIATLIFLFILITGIILWFPKTNRILVQRLKLKTDGSWKRLNHDLHIVLGFYSAIFLFIFAFTGLAWSFQWFNKGIYTVTRSEMKQPEPPQSTIVAGKKAITYDEAYNTALASIENVEYYNLRKPTDSTGAFTINVLPQGVHESASDNYYIDQFSGQLIGSLKFDDKNLGQRVRSTFKPVHTGSIFGWPSKIIAFITCLLGVSFPITGVIMWINRLKKERRRKQGFAFAGQSEPVFAEEDEEEEL